jgi:hypothetical protein
LPGAPAVIGADHTREGYALAMKLALIYPPDLAAKGLDFIGHERESDCRDRCQQAAVQE